LLAAGFIAAPATGAVTHVSITVRKADGSPASNADVGVYYLEAPEEGEVEGSSGRLKEMASGKANGSGQFSTDLNTNMVDSTGDGGDGRGGIFNALIVSEDTVTGKAAADVAVLKLGVDNGSVSSSQDPKSRVYTSGSTSQVMATEDLAAGDPHCNVGGVCYVNEAYRYRYVRAGAISAGKGVKNSYSYSSTSLEDRQTSMKIPITFNMTDWASTSSFMLEHRERGTVAPYVKAGAYHRYVWANYRWVRRYYWHCASPASCTDWREWEPLHFAGIITDNNPNVGPDQPAIGVKPYDPPPVPSNSNFKFALTNATSGWERFRNQSRAFGFSFNIGDDFINHTAYTMYGNITRVKFIKVTGCSGTRWVYGSNTDLHSTAVVNSACVS
jgi:hypothetical protein